MKKPYKDADFKLPYFNFSWSKKYDTVRGIIGKTHGVNRARNPAINPNINISI